MANGQNVEEAANGAIATALSALVWTILEPDRADRLLALTGLSVDRLRDGVEEPALLAALLQFLEAHEPDLIACAAALELDPAALVRARTILEAQSA